MYGVLCLTGLLLPLFACILAFGITSPYIPRTSTNDNSNHHKKGMNFTNPLVGGGQMKSSTVLKSAGSKITEKMK